VNLFERDGSQKEAIDTIRRAFPHTYIVHGLYNTIITGCRAEAGHPMHPHLLIDRAVGLVEDERMTLEVLSHVDGVQFLVPDELLFGPKAGAAAKKKRGA
jgi:hypothetical protein